MLGNYPVSASLPCTDLADARKFYGETLGLEEIQFPGIPEEASSESAQEAALFLCGGGTMLMVYARPTPTKADHTAAGWMVPNFDELAKELMNRGVTFEKYPEIPDVTWDDRNVARAPQGYHAAWFLDPDGNILSIYELPEL